MLALQFHAQLAALSRNQILQATLASMDRMQAGPYRERGGAASAIAAVEAHQRLLDALRTGVADAADADADAEMRRHLHEARHRLHLQ